MSTKIVGCEFRDLKTQAIIAHMKKLAKTEGYTFATMDGYHDELSLYIQVGYSNMIALALPYKHYPEIIDMIQPAIQLMQKLPDMDIEFRMEKRIPNDWW